MNLTKFPNRDALYNALNIYRDAMRSFIFKNMKMVPGLLQKENIQNETDTDINDFPHLFRRHWSTAFVHRFDSDREVRSAVGVITEARNMISHPGAEDLPSGYASGRLYEIADMLGQINAPEQKREVEAIRDKLLTNVANNFTKDNFDVDNTRSTAIELKQRGEIKQDLIEQLEGPTDENRGNPQTLKSTNLRVTMPDGTVIHHHNGTETYIEVLEKFGLEEVMRVRPNIVAKEQFPLKTKGIKRGEFWVRGVIGFCNGDRKAELEKIADKLDKELIVERVGKN